MFSPDSKVLGHFVPTRKGFLFGFVLHIRELDILCPHYSQEVGTRVLNRVE